MARGSVFELAVLSVCFLVCASVALAEGGKKATVTGTVAATYDEDENLESATLTTDDGDVYNITMDKNGRKMAAAMNGKKAEVTGTVKEKDEEKWLTVTSYKELVEKEDEGDDDDDW